MGDRLSPHDAELYRRIDEVLHYLWDPIGVAGVPEARDEYDAYVPPVFQLLSQGAGEDQLRPHLNAIATEQMGLSGDPARTHEAVAALLDWREVLGERYRD